MRIFLIIIGSILLLLFIDVLIETILEKKTIKERTATGNYPEAKWCYYTFQDYYGWTSVPMLDPESLNNTSYMDGLKEIKKYFVDKAPYTLIKVLMRTVKPAIGTENGYTRVYFHNFNINNIMKYSDIIIRNSRIIYYYTDATNFVIDVYKLFAQTVLYDYITARDHLLPSEEEVLYNYNKTEEMVRSELEKIEWADYVNDKVDIHYYFNKENISDTVKTHIK